MASEMEKNGVYRAAGMNLAQIKAAFGAAAIKLLTLLEERASERTWETPVPHPYFGSD